MQPRLLALTRGGAGAGGWRICRKMLLFLGGRKKKKKNSGEGAEDAALRAENFSDITSAATSSKSQAPWQGCPVR